MSGRNFELPPWVKHDWSCVNDPYFLLLAEQRYWNEELVRIKKRMVVIEEQLHQLNPMYKSEELHKSDVDEK